MKRALFYLITTIFYIQHAYANTEKLILQVDSQNLNLCDPQFETLTKAQTALSLKPPFSEIQNSLIPQNDFQWYNLDDLKDNSNYEIRVSYPAIVTILNYEISFMLILMIYVPIDTSRFSIKNCK